MPEFPITLIPVGGGYAVHTTGCDCKEAAPEAPPGRRAYAAQSIAEALATHYRAVNCGPIAPERIVRRPCARNIPKDDLRPLTWGERHQLYVNEAARAIAQYANSAAYLAQQAADAINDSRADIDGHPVPMWMPSPHETKVAVRAAHLAKAMARCVGDVTTEDDDALLRIVTQSEMVLREELAVQSDIGTHYADAMDRAFAEAERYGAGQVEMVLRSTLAKVHAHRTLRDAVL